MYIGVSLRARGLSGASLTVKKWQLRRLSSWLMRESQNFLVEMMEELRKCSAVTG